MQVWRDRQRNGRKPFAAGGPRQDLSEGRPAFWRVPVDQYQLAAHLMTVGLVGESRHPRLRAPQDIAAMIIIARGCDKRIQRLSRHTHPNEFVLKRDLTVGRDK